MTQPNDQCLKCGHQAMSYILKSEYTILKLQQEVADLRLNAEDNKNLRNTRNVLQEELYNTKVMLHDTKHDLKQTKELLHDANHNLQVLQKLDVSLIIYLLGFTSMSNLYTYNTQKRNHLDETKTNKRYREEDQDDMGFTKRQKKNVSSQMSILGPLMIKYQLEDDLYNITHFFIQENIGTNRTHLAWYKTGCNNGHIHKLDTIRSTSQITTIAKKLSKKGRKIRKNNYVVDKNGFKHIICMVSMSNAKGRSVAFNSIVERGLECIDDIWNTYIPDGTNNNSDKYVYFIRARGTEMVKIGFSNNPHKRLKQLNTGNAIDLKLEYSFKTESYRQHERMLHTHFKGYHVRGEWFRLTHLKFAIIAHNVCKLQQ
jgi:hypothetical protein